MGRPPAARKNVLPNTYVPVLSRKTTVSVLSRLPKRSLVELAYVWPKIVNTQPHLRSSQLLRKEWNKVVQQKLAAAREMRVNKSRVIDLILVDFWPNGLNLLQLSQLDCQLIVDRPNAYSWVLSVVHDNHGTETAILLEPKAFLDALAADLSHIFLTYIYICRHPRYPLIIIRIQVFDLQNVAVNATRPHIASHKPYFLAIPLNSPYIIHSPGNDLVKNIVLQVVERCLPQKPHNLLTLKTPVHQAPVKSLEAMHIFLGSSRFGNSLGPWTPYADATVDISPLGNIEDHSVLADKTDTENIDKDIKQIANLRFKGSIDGTIRSGKLFDTPQHLDRAKRRKKAFRIYEGNLSDEEDANQVQKDEFSSIAPVQYAEFVIKERFDPEESSEENYSSITLKLLGSDVFAGLHALSVTHDDPKDAIVDPTLVPGWLTGEEGRSTGTVKDGKFTRY